jgi:hypothetical protein
MSEHVKLKLHAEKVEFWKGVRLLPPKARELQARGYVALFAGDTRRAARLFDKAGEEMVREYNREGKKCTG